MPELTLDAMLSQADASARAKLGHGLRPLQRETLAKLALGHHVFASLPTGYGKSLCCWAPAAAWGWRTWVICPLVSLIEDQAMACAELGVRAVALHGGLSAEERGAREAGLRDAEIVFISPERFLLWWESGRLSALQAEGAGPNLLALDEMHCFEEWREFRDAYRGVFGAIKRVLGSGCQLLGLSASLSEAHSRAWMEEFAGPHERVAADIGREKLILRVIPMEEEEERWLLLPILLREINPGDSILIYCATRAECDELSRWLGSLGHLACAYHAGIPAGVRAERSRAFRAGQLPFVCATAAFGMGIDFPRVSRVIHFSTPYDLESYWQEAGRAGRDGRLAYAISLWRRSDITRARRMNERQRGRYYDLWKAWLEGACRKRAVASALGLSMNDCGTCDRCASSRDDLPTWLNAASSLRRGDAWWTEPAANGVNWAREKIFSGQ
ncbi:MAG: DEAD/DEAH box helicase [Proteobacteria bacterium]|nr:MAG: DEAD/DEAH box helicase [Pseudomonadota bacterium]